MTLKDFLSVVGGSFLGSHFGRKLEEELGDALDDLFDDLFDEVVEAVGNIVSGIVSRAQLDSDKREANSLIQASIERLSDYEASQNLVDLVSAQNFCADAYRRFRLLGLPGMGGYAGAATTYMQIINERSTVETERADHWTRRFQRVRDSSKQHLFEMRCKAESDIRIAFRLGYGMGHTDRSRVTYHEPTDQLAPENVGFDDFRERAMRVSGANRGYQYIFVVSRFDPMTGRRDFQTHDGWDEGSPAVAERQFYDRFRDRTLTWRREEKRVEDEQLDIFEEKVWKPVEELIRSWGADES